MWFGGLTSWSATGPFSISEDVGVDLMEEGTIGSCGGVDFSMLMYFLNQSFLELEKKGEMARN